MLLTVIRVRKGYVGTRRAPAPSYSLVRQASNIKFQDE